MRVIAGTFRGRSLKAPKGEGTRPTTDRVRESMMSVVASARGGFDGAVVLDAFAGSGALGLEALSRGARCVHFYERAGEALKALGSNITTLGLDARCACVHRGDVLKTPPLHAPAPFDLVFLDPPYAENPERVLGMVGALACAGALAPDALVVYEHAASSASAVDEALGSVEIGGVVLAQRKKYGDTVVDVLRVAKAGAQGSGEDE